MHTILIGAHNASSLGAQAPPILGADRITVTLGLPKNTWHLMIRDVFVEHSDNLFL